MTISQNALISTAYKTRHVNDLNLTKNKKHFPDHSVRTTGPHSLEFY